MSPTIGQVSSSVPSPSKVEADIDSIEEQPSVTTSQSDISNPHESIFKLLSRAPYYCWPSFSSPSRGFCHFQMDILFRSLSVCWLWYLQPHRTLMPPWSLASFSLGQGIWGFWASKRYIFSVIRALLLIVHYSRCCLVTEGRFRASPVMPFAYKKFYSKFVDLFCDCRFCPAHAMACLASLGIPPTAPPASAIVMQDLV